MILFILTPSIPIHLVNSGHISGSMAYDAQNREK